MTKTDARKTAATLLADAYGQLVLNAASRELVERSGYGAALLDAEGRTVAATDTVPLANVEAIARTCLAAADRFQAGDVVITNDPYSGGTTVRDHFVLTPVHDSAAGLVGVAVVCAPFADVGGMKMGSVFPDANDLFAEGVRTTPLRLQRGGKPDADVLACLTLNTRLPALIELDIKTMTQVVVELAGRASSLLASGEAAALIEAASRQLAAALSKNGSSSGQRALTGWTGAGDTPELQLALTVKDGIVTADFDGSSPQLRGSTLSATLATTTNAVARAVRERAGVGLSGAVTDAIRVNAPASSVLNCDLPTPVGGSIEGTAHDVSLLVRDCLDDVLGPVDAA